MTFTDEQLRAFEQTRHEHLPSWLVGKVKPSQYYEEQAETWQAISDKRYLDADKAERGVNPLSTHYVPVSALRAKAKEAYDTAERYRQLATWFKNSERSS